MAEPLEQQTAREVMANAECLINGDQLQDIYARMAKDIEAAIAKLDPVILCVMMGGFVPAAEIMKRLSFPFEFDYLHATRYRGDTQGGELVWKVSPGIPLVDRHVLVIDDILDEGHTLAAILAALDAQGAASVRTAIVLEKQHDRRDAELRDPDFLGTQVPDRYVFGAGMDYRGYLRQLPGVYVLPQD